MRMDGRALRAINCYRARPTEWRGGENTQQRAGNTAIDGEQEQAEPFSV